VIHSFQCDFFIVIANLFNISGYDLAHLTSKRGFSELGLLWESHTHNRTPTWPRDLSPSIYWRSQVQCSNHRALPLFTKGPWKKRNYMFLFLLSAWPSYSMSRLDPRPVGMVRAGNEVRSSFSQWVLGMSRIQTQGLSILSQALQLVSYSANPTYNT